jgi:hypothetical protein
MNQNLKVKRWKCYLFAVAVFLIAAILKRVNLLNEFYETSNIFLSLSFITIPIMCGEEVFHARNDFKVNPSCNYFKVRVKRFFLLLLFILLFLHYLIYSNIAELILFLLFVGSLVRWSYLVIIFACKGGNKL